MHGAIDSAHVPLPPYLTSFIPCFLLLHISLTLSLSLSLHQTIPITTTHITPHTLVTKFTPPLAQLGAAASMDAYGGLSVDDLLDLPNDEFLSSSSSSSAAAATAAVSDFYLHHPSSAASAHFEESSIPTYSTDFTDIFRVPTEEAAELEWLSNYMDDSFTDFPASELTSASVNFHALNAKGFHGRARSKRSRPPSMSAGGENQTPASNTGGAESAEVARRCTHCASEKTPQWRTGPLGPKTLCNACGVRFKSGRLVPEYRPAASPTFVLTQHSNSHRKVLELRRQKEQLRQQQQQEAYGRHFRVC